MARLLLRILAGATGELMKRPLLLGWLALVATLTFAVPAMAQGDQPVIVEYVAPPECASSLAFQVLLETQVARFSNPGRTWRWSVRIRRKDGLYEGTVASEDGAHTATATRCDDVNAAIALFIAGGEPETPEPAPPPLCIPPPPVPVAPPPPIDRPRPALVHAPPPDRGTDQAWHPVWRLGIRGDFSNHGVVRDDMGTPLGATALAGAMGVLSIEVPGAFGKMMFEVAAGGLSSTDGAYPLKYTVVDTQTCLLDLPLGATGLSVLGCLRVAGASYSSVYEEGGTQYPQTGGALWAGAGGRLRWQAPVGLFLEASVTGMYGTVSSGESDTPGWIDLGLSAGFRL